VGSDVVVVDLHPCENWCVRFFESSHHALLVHLIVVHSSREMDFLDMLCALAVRVELFQVGFLGVLCSIGD